MLKTLRQILGTCNNQWFHTWKYSGNPWIGQGTIKPNEIYSRTCTNCNKKEIAEYLPSIINDGKPLTSWLTITEI